MFFLSNTSLIVRALIKKVIFKKCMLGLGATVSLIGLTTGVSAIAHAETNSTQLGRYISITNTPTAAQSNLLSQIIQVSFPQNIQTVNDAIDYLARLAGYSLIPKEHMSNALKLLISKPLPLVDRHVGPIALKKGLSILVGPSFYLVQDPINRTIDFRLTNAFKKYNPLNEKTKFIIVR